MTPSKRPTSRRATSAAAEEVEIALPTGLGELANAVLPRMVHGVIAIGQGYGTLTEVAHAIKLGRPVVGLESWEIRSPGSRRHDDALRPARSPREAVEWLLRRLARDHHLPVSPPDSRGAGVVGVRQSFSRGAGVVGVRQSFAGGRGRSAHDHADATKRWHRQSASRADQMCIGAGVPGVCSRFSTSRTPAMARTRISTSRTIS